MADEKVIIEIDLVLPNGEIQKTKGEIVGKLGDAGKKAGSTFSTGFASSLAGNLGAIAVSKAIQGITNAISGSVDAAKKLEVFETQFKTILGSAKAAQKQLSDLQKFAATTPFQIDGLALSTRQLLSFGVASEDIIPTLTQLGDLAAGTGSSIDDLTIPFGRLASTQKLTLIELDKFADRGINLYAKLAKQTGGSLKTIRDDISKGKVGYEEFTTALNSLTTEGGTFFKAAEAQSKTLSGVLSTLKDNVFNLQATFGSAFKGVLVTSVTAAIGAVQRFTVFIAENAVSITTSIINIGRAINDFVVAPLELLYNIGKTVFSGLAALVQTFVVGIASGAEKVGTVLNKIGVIDDSQLEGLRTFAASSKEVLDDFSEDASTSIDGIFAGTVYGNADEFLTNLQNNVLSANEITAGLEAKPAEEKVGEGVDFGAAIQGATAYDSAMKGLRSSIISTAKTTKEATQKMNAFFLKSGKAFQQGFGQAIGQGFSAVGQALVNGENAMDAFAKAFIGTIGQILIQQGTQFILTGIGISANPYTLGAGAPMIAAGAAMAVAGGAMSALGGSGGSAGAATPTGASAGGSFGITPFEAPDLSEDEEIGLTGEIGESASTTIIFQGDILGDEESGAKIVDLINRANESTDVKINQQVLA